MRDKESMSPQNTSDEGAPTARLEFARRLRELRIPRGFRTARSLARCLEIDENRYTRYERAEVEPDLTMIRRICEALNVTPNDLLGDVDTGADAQPSASQARPPAEGPGMVAAPRPARHHQDPISTAAWLLAEVATEIRAELPASLPSVTPPTSSLAVIAETGRLYKSLMEHPFETIADLLSEPTIANAKPAGAHSLQERIEAFMALVKSPS